jgi:hypothetical protein
VPWSELEEAEVEVGDMEEEIEKKEHGDCRLHSCLTQSSQTPLCTPMCLCYMVELSVLAAEAEGMKESLANIKKVH